MSPFRKPSITHTFAPPPVRALPVSDARRERLAEAAANALTLAANGLCALRNYDTRTGEPERAQRLDSAIREISRLLVDHELGAL